ncbi:MAG: hypothetical protein ACRDG7_07340, partial [Candidatus Limnocylindria bacterium]
MPRFVRYALVLIGGVFVLFVVVVVVIAVAYSPAYAYRYLAWMDADVGDHARFPSRAIEAEAEPHRFA